MSDENLKLRLRVVNPDTGAVAVAATESGWISEFEHLVSIRRGNVKRIATLVRANAAVLGMIAEGEGALAKQAHGYVAAHLGRGTEDEGEAVVGDTGGDMVLQPKRRGRPRMTDAEKKAAAEARGRRRADAETVAAQEEPEPDDVIVQEAPVPADDWDDDLLLGDE